jgi:hypothetical protein
MLDKLFARLRSWRQADSQAAPLLSTSSLGAGGLPTLSGPMTPPPLPADAWAESESGIVITDSGIIILGPDSEPRAAAKSAAPARPALPSLPAAPPPTPASKRSLTPGELDWDDVLARARARAQESLDDAQETAPPPPPSARARPKAQGGKAAKPAKNGK